MELIEARSIFSAATGFIQRGGFDWTCNPYLGCSFGCTYCYAMFLPQNRRPKEEWGRWFQAKAVPETDGRFVRSLEGDSDGFRLVLDGGYVNLGIAAQVHGRDGVVTARQHTGVQALDHAGRPGAVNAFPSPPAAGGSMKVIA